MSENLLDGAVAKELEWIYYSNNYFQSFWFSSFIDKKEVKKQTSIFLIGIQA